MDPAGPLSVTDNIEEQRNEGSELDYWHAVASTKPVPEGFESLEVPAGLWVVFEAEGKFPPEVLQGMWLMPPRNGFLPTPYRWAPGPEMLSVQVEPGGTHGRGQLWIPIERQNYAEGADPRSCRISFKGNTFCRYSRVRTRSTDSAASAFSVPMASAA